MSIQFAFLTDNFIKRINQLKAIREIITTEEYETGIGDLRQEIGLPRGSSSVPFALGRATLDAAGHQAAQRQPK